MHALDVYFAHEQVASLPQPAALWPRRRQSTCYSQAIAVWAIAKKKYTLVSIIVKHSYKRPQNWGVSVSAASLF